ncbi:MAG TPA: hypothetical protein VGM89_13860 [Puia sp.]
MGTLRPQEEAEKAYNLTADFLTIRSWGLGAVWVGFGGAVGIATGDAGGGCMSWDGMAGSAEGAGKEVSVVSSARKRCGTRLGLWKTCGGWRLGAD